MRAAKLRKLGRSIAPRDLSNPRNVSGYDYVNRVAPGIWRAESNVGGNRRSDREPMRGPGRQFPEEAAADFCHWFNGDKIAPVATLATPGHEYTVDETDTDPEYQAALGVMRDRRAQRAGKQGYVYLIIEDEPGGAIQFGKLGYSTNPQKRVAELQTGNPRPLRLLYAMPGTEADERALHRKHIKHNVLMEWFRPTRELLLEFGAEHAIRPDTSTVRRVA